MNYLSLDGAARKAELDTLYAEYNKIKAEGISLDLSRGKPGADQLDITMGMLGVISHSNDCFTETGFDCRNYGNLDGLPEAKRLFSELLGISRKNLSRR